MNAEQSSRSSKTAPILLAVICLGLAAATVFAVKTSYALRFELKRMETELQQRQNGQAPVADTTEAAALRQRNSELQETVDRLRKELEQRPETVTPAAVALPVVAATNAPASTNRLSWIERIRQEDPARYKQMMEEREQRRQQRDAMMQEQYARLDDRLKSAQSKEEVELINQLTTTLQKMDDLRVKWDGVQQLPEEERQKQIQELRQESWQTSQTYRELRAQDRQMQLENLAYDIGYRDTKEVSAFVDSVQRINKDTDASGRGMNMGRTGGSPPAQPDPTRR